MARPRFLMSAQLPPAVVGQPYMVDINIDHFPLNEGIVVVSEGAMPKGMVLINSDRLEGPVEQDGTFNFKLAVKVGDKVVAEKEFHLLVTAPAAPLPEPEPESLPELVNEEPAPAVVPAREPPPAREPEEPETADKHRSSAWAWMLVAIIFMATLILIGYLLGKGSNPQAANATPTPIVQLATEAPATEAVTQAVIEVPATEVPATQAATQAATEAAPVTDGKTLAESILGKTLPWPVPAYVADQPGFPQICAGLCWDKSKLDKGILVWYGPSDGSEDITQSDAPFGDGTTGPLELMRNGTVHTVIFANGLEAQMEVCAITDSKLDGKLIADWLKEAGITEQCGRFALPAGWHVVQDNMNAPIAGFGIRLSASGWASMTESKIITYTGYWKIDGKTAIWTGPDGIEILMTPAMVSMMQDYGNLTTVVFTTTQPGQVLFCNGTVSGDATLSSPDGACHLYNVPAGTFTYTGEKRTSAGISWQPAVK